ncbi:MAG: hypothetical protein OXG18_00485 [Gemmatimonadetes bacterium]|nr:hypothetical protein [Gemmatimonadota bacterium]
MNRFLPTVGPLLLSACIGPHDADSANIRIDSDQITWESPQGDLWEIVDVLERDGVVWVLTSTDPFVHGYQQGAEVVSFGSQGDGPNELRSARALVDLGGDGEITVWDAASRLYRTFSATGSLVLTRDAGRLGTVRGDIDLVTFGDALRVAATMEGTVRAEYRGTVESGGGLWTGMLARIDDEGGFEHVVDFADLRGASRVDLGAGTVLVPVPLWDVCPDHRIVLLDPIDRHIYLVGSSWGERDSVSVPWDVRPITRMDRLGYLRSQMEAEFRGQQLDDSEIRPILERAEAGSRDQFATSTPLGVDIRCAEGRVWIQEFDGSAHPLGFGWRWRTITLAGHAPVYSQVALPPGFRPYRISESQLLGVVTDSIGLQRVASILIPSSLRSP